MAAVVAAYTPTASTTNASTYASQSFTPVAGDLLVVFAAVSGSVAAGSMTASANGITFTRVDSAAYGGGAHTLYAFVADQLVPSSPVAMTVTMNVTGDAGTGCAISTLRVSGMSKVGTAAIKQSAKQVNQTTGTPAPTFGTAATTTNPTVGAVGLEGAGTSNIAVPPSGTTERCDVGWTTPTNGLESWSRDSGFTGTTVTWTSATVTIFASMILELDASTVSVIDKNASDTGAGSDAPTAKTMSGIGDTFAGTEGTPSKDMSGVPDTGTFSESAQVIGWPERADDKGYFGVNYTVNISLAKPVETIVEKSSSDSATATDAVSAKSATATDSGTGTDVVSARSATAADTGTGTDAVTARALTAAESGTGTDAATAKTMSGAGDTGTGTDAVGARTATLSATDTGTWTDAVGALSATLSASDTASGTDAVSARGLTAADAGTGTEAVTARELQAFDSGSSTEGASVGGMTADKSATDTWTATDAVAALTRSGIGDSATFTDRVAARWLTAADAAATLDQVAARVLAATDAAMFSDSATHITETAPSGGLFTPPAVEQGPVMGRGGLWRFYDRSRSASVLITGTSYVQKEAISDIEIEAGDLYFGGGRTYRVTPAEVAAIIAAGLTVDELTVETIERPLT